MITPPDAQRGARQKASDSHAHHDPQGMLLRQPVHSPLGTRYQAVLYVPYSLQRRTCFTREAIKNRLFLILSWFLNGDALCVCFLWPGYRLVFERGRW